MKIINYVKTHISQNNSFNIPVSIRLVHILNWYDVSHYTINCPILNKQDFKNELWLSILDLLWSAGIPIICD